MGKRKLRFDVRKNYERKKYQQRKEQMKDVTLLVSFPISSYKTAVAPCVDTLRKRLIQSAVLPVGWSSSHVENMSLAVHKLHINPLLSSADVMFMTTVNSDF